MQVYIYIFEEFHHHFALHLIACAGHPSKSFLNESSIRYLLDCGMEQQLQNPAVLLCGDIRKDVAIA